MNEYQVTWTIQVTADGPKDAARLARAMQTDPGTTATVFEVTDESGRTVEIDLD